MGTNRELTKLLALNLYVYKWEEKGRNLSMQDSLMFIYLTIKLLSLIKVFNRLP